MNYRACFAAYLRRRGRRESTVRSYGLALAEFCKYCGGQGRRSSVLRQMVPQQMEAYKLYLLEHRGLRPSTVNRRLSALSAFARFLVNKGMLAGNPLDLVSRVGGKAVTSEHLSISYEGVQQLRAAVHEDVLNLRDRVVVELLYAGLTVRELCDLKYDDSWSADKNAIIAGERTVALHAGACLALEHYMILRPILRGDYFLVGSGPQWSLRPGSVYGIVGRLARLAGVSIGIKDLRLARYAAEAFGFQPAYIPAALAA